MWTKRRSTNVFLPSTWATADRPTDDIDGYTGYNTDLKGLETYILSTDKWRILFGEWTVSTRPTTTDLDIGSKGYNSELGQEEMWDGTNWVTL